MISDSTAANSINMGGSSTVSVPCMIASGGVSATANLTETACGSPITHAPSTPDPYAGLQAPTASGPCLTVTSNTLSSGNYCSGIHLSSQSSYTFGAGPYYIGGGGLQIDGGVTAIGTGVTFFMQPGATVTINATTTVSFSAPTSGTYAGIVFFGDQTQSGTNSFTGGSNLTLTGSLYFKTQEVTYNGGSAANACTQIVADTIKLTGSNFFNSGCAGGGLTNVTTIELVE